MLTSSHIGGVIDRLQRADIHQPGLLAPINSALLTLIMILEIAEVVMIFKEKKNASGRY